MSEKSKKILNEIQSFLNYQRFNLGMLGEELKKIENDVWAKRFCEGRIKQTELTIEGLERLIDEVENHDIQECKD